MPRNYFLFVCAVALTFVSFGNPSVSLAAGGEPQSARSTQTAKADTDRPQVVAIEVEISIGDSNSGKRSPQIVDHFRLTTLENNRAMAQLGQEVPVVVGTQSFGGRGAPVRTQTVQRATGTIVEAEPRVTDAGVVVALTIEKSWLEYPPAESDDEETLRDIDTPTTYTTQLKTTLLIADGKAEILSAKVSGGTEAREAVIEVSASVGTSGRGSGTRRAVESSESTRPQSRDRSRSSSSGRDTGNESRGRSSFGSPPQPRTRSGFSQRTENDDDSSDEGGRANTIAARLFEQLDGNGDGELTAQERDRASQMLKVLGFDEDDPVTIDLLAQKMRDRAGRSRQPPSGLESGGRGRSGFGRGNRPREDDLSEPDTAEPDKKPDDEAESF